MCLLVSLAGISCKGGGPAATNGQTKTSPEPVEAQLPSLADIPDELLTEAVATYTKIGMPKHIEMAETLLGEV